MADGPILFSGPMVRALLDDRKTQTRRFLDLWTDYEAPALVRDGKIIAGDDGDREYQWPRTRAVGDRLYVREAWRTDDAADHTKPSQMTPDYPIKFEADGLIAGSDTAFGRLRPGIHMPRWASRLTLTVTDVRVERLQDISEADAIAEGVERLHHGFYPYGVATFMTTIVGGEEVPAQCCASAHDSYMMLWNSINGAGAWQANPWVAAYTFTVERGNIDELARAA